MQHYTKNTARVLLFCKTCNKKTMHRVDQGRVGPCENSHVKQKFLKAKKINETGALF
jgi:ribosomal protein L44E